MKRLYPIIAVLLLTACGDSDEESLATAAPPDSPEKLYSDARVLLAENDYQDAIKAFSEVERQHPYSQWARHGQIMSAYTSYRAEEYDQAVSILERFVKLHPNDESTPYAYYLIALSYYDQISDVGRDQKMTDFAMQSLRDVVRRFPDTEYARDAKIKLDLTVDHLAGKEMQVGRYYLVRDDYLAAANRFRSVVENYQTTSHAPEALHRLVESYLKLGVKEEAKRYAAVLGHNYPSSVWYRDSYRLMTGETTQAIVLPEGDESWWDVLIP